MDRFNFRNQKDSSKNARIFLFPFFFLFLSFPFSLFLRTILRETNGNSGNETLGRWKHTEAYMPVRDRF